MLDCGEEGGERADTISSALTKCREGENVDDGRGFVLCVKKGHTFWNEERKMCQVMMLYQRVARITKGDLLSSWNGMPCEYLTL